MAPLLLRLADPQGDFRLVQGNCRKKLLTIGSNHHWIRPFDTVAGVGSMIPLNFCPASSVRIVSLRGPLTWNLLGRPEVMSLGDPGLLASKIFEACSATAPNLLQQSSSFVVVPHVSEVDHYQSMFPSMDVIDPRDDPIRVFARIRSAEFVFSSSLHGIVVADSFGIPSVWLQRTIKPAGIHKFLDYFLSVGRSKWLRPYRFHKNPAKLLSQKLPAAEFFVEEVIEALSTAVLLHRSH